ncbi:MAG: DNA polymerase III subunit delta [Candidatus Dasytiphilus stammeri]
MIIKIYPEQLTAQLTNKLTMCYMLVGNDQFLLQESQDSVYKVAQQHGFNEYLRLTLNNNTNWNDFLQQFHTPSLFAKRRTVLLTLTEKKLKASLGNKLLKLVKKIQHEQHDLLLIIKSPLIHNTTWVTALSVVIVYCFTPEKNQLPRWLDRRAKFLGLILEKEVISLLCYNYERNLFALVQTLEILSLLWPDGYQISLNHVVQVVTNVALFINTHWVDAILSGDSHRSLHILQQLRQQGNEINNLCYLLQHDLMLVLTLIRRFKNNFSSLQFFLDQHFFFYKKRRSFFIKALQRLNPKRINLAICLLARIEIALKQNHEDMPLLWCCLEQISLLLSNNDFPVCVYLSL